LRLPFSTIFTPVGEKVTVNSTPFTSTSRFNGLSSRVVIVVSPASGRAVPPSYAPAACSTSIAAFLPLMAITLPPG
jgi:hypothetical protein